MKVKNPDSTVGTITTKPSPSEYDTVLRYGTELTRFDPVFHDDGAGGMRYRFIADDGQIFHGQMTPRLALRMIATLATYVARNIAAER